MVCWNSSSWRRAAHQQVADLLKAEAVFLLEAVDQVVYIIAAVGQAAFDRFALALVEYVAVYVAQTARADQDARAVRVAQAALDAVTGVDAGRNLAVQAKTLAEFVQKLFFNIIRLNRHPAFPFLCPILDIEYILPQSCKYVKLCRL